MSSLYLHIPFCASKCPYCDFYSQLGSQSQVDDYVALLLKHIGIVAQQNYFNAPCATIFFGGGTPSLLNADQIETLLDKINSTFGIATDAEITMETNPGTVTTAQLCGYRQSGVNRLSLGVQSLNQDNLRTLGRIHSVNESISAIGGARDAGFDNLNLDLMFALPGQDLAALEQEVATLLSFDPEHISLYGLSIEAGTPFAQQLAAGTITTCSETLYAQQYVLLDKLLATAGYEHYEISNFARSKKHCRHNQNYWQRESCLAIGAGAHGFRDQGSGERWHNRADLAYYRAVLVGGDDPAELLETFTGTEAMKEYAYLTLRTKAGLNRNKFKYKFDVYPEAVFTVAIASCGEYLILSEDSYRFNLAGWLIYDHLISHFL